MAASMASMRWMLRSLRLPVQLPACNATQQQQQQQPSQPSEPAHLPKICRMQHRRETSAHLLPRSCTRGQASWQATAARLSTAQLPTLGPKAALSGTSCAVWFPSTLCLRMQRSLVEGLHLKGNGRCAGVAVCPVLHHAVDCTPVEGRRQAALRAVEGAHHLYEQRVSYADCLVVQACPAGLCSAAPALPSSPGRASAAAESDGKEIIVCQRVAQCSAGEARGLACSTSAGSTMLREARGVSGPSAALASSTCTFPVSGTESVIDEDRLCQADTRRLLLRRGTKLGQQDSHVQPCELSKAF